MRLATLIIGTLSLCFGALFSVLAIASFDRLVLRTFRWLDEGAGGFPIPTVWIADHRFEGLECIGVELVLIVVAFAFAAYGFFQLRARVDDAA